MSKHRPKCECRHIRTDHRFGRFSCVGYCSCRKYRETKTVRHVHSFVRNPYKHEGQPKWYCGLCGMPKPGEPFEGKQGPDRLVEEATEFVKRPKVQLEVSMGQRVKES